jgi:hypothetical protein
MEDRPWRGRAHVTENGVESVRLPAKIFLKDNYSRLTLVSKAGIMTGSHPVDKNEFASHQ